MYPGCSEQLVCVGSGLGAGVREVAGPGGGGPNTPLGSETPHRHPCVHRACCQSAEGFNYLLSKWPTQGLT